MVDIARPSSVKRQKKIRRIIYGAAGVLLVLLVSYGVSRLKPAAPGVDKATVWIDTVKRGSMVRQVRGSGAAHATSSARSSTRSSTTSSRFGIR